MGDSSPAMPHDCVRRCKAVFMLTIDRSILSRPSSSRADCALAERNVYEIAWRVCVERLAAVHPAMFTGTCTAALVNWLLLVVFSLAVREGFLALTTHNASRFNLLALFMAGVIAVRFSLQRLQDRWLRCYGRESVRAFVQRITTKTGALATVAQRRGRRFADDLRAVEQVHQLSTSLLLAPADAAALVLTVTVLSLIDLPWGMAVMVVLTATVVSARSNGHRRRSNQPFTEDNFWRAGLAVLGFVAGHRCLAGELDLPWLFVGVVWLTTVGGPLTRLLSTLRCYYRLAQDRHERI